jgi:hypothetical protein
MDDAMDPRVRQEMHNMHIVNKCITKDAQQCVITAQIQNGHLNHQNGDGLPHFTVYRHPRSSKQNGGGFGSIFSGFMKFIGPALSSIFQNGAREVGNHALNTASNIFGDLIQGESFKTSGKRRFEETKLAVVDQLKNKVGKMMYGHGGIQPPPNKKARAQKILFSIKGPPVVTGRTVSAKSRLKKKKKPVKRLNTNRKLGGRKKKPSAKGSRTKKKKPAKKKKKPAKKPAQKKKKNKRKTTKGVRRSNLFISSRQLGQGYRGYL